MTVLRMFSVGQVIGEPVHEDDFKKRFAAIDAAVAVDLERRFTGWQSEIVQSVAIEPASRIKPRTLIC